MQTIKYYSELLSAAHRYEVTLDDSLESDLMRAELDNYATAEWINRRLFEDRSENVPEHDCHLSQDDGCQFCTDWYQRGGDN